MLKRILLLILVLLTVAFPALAQAELTETLEIPESGFSIDYPEGWFTSEDEEIGLFVLAAEEEDLDVLAVDEPAGQLVAIFPASEDFVGSASTEEVAEAFTENTEFDEQLTDGAEELDLESGYEAFYVAGLLSNSTYYGVVVVTGDNGSTFVLVGGAPEDEIEEFEATFFAMLDTIVIDEGEEEEEEGGEDDGTIEYGDTVEGEITDDEFAVAYVFEGEEGDVVTVTMIDISDEGDLDPYLLILNEDADELFAENDNAEEDLDGDGDDAQILEFELPEDGVYVIIATRPDLDEGEGEGEFELTLEEGEGGGGGGDDEDDGGDTGDVEIIPIEYGDTVEGEISDDAIIVYYVFEAEEGDEVTVTVEATDGDLDTYVAVLDSDGDILEENDDAEEEVGDNSLNSQIEGFEIEEDGEYIIAVTRFGFEDGDSEGEFELTLEVDN